MVEAVVNAVGNKGWELVAWSPTLRSSLYANGQGRRQQGASRGIEEGGGEKKPASAVYDSHTKASSNGNPVPIYGFGCSWLNVLATHKVCIKGVPSWAILPAATLRQKLQIKLAISPNHSVLRTGKPVVALTP